MDERILGIVGGVGPESTLDYYRRLVDGFHARHGADDHPALLINSLPSGPMIRQLVAGDFEPVRRRVATAVDQLAAGGAGIAIIASVATHAVFEAVASTAPLPMLSIIRATCRSATSLGLRRPAIFAPRVTTEGVFFSRPFDDAGIELVRPAENDRAWINDIYLGELVRGIFRDVTRARLLEIFEGLQRSAGADSLILGGTELSLILRESSYSRLPVLNAAEIHVQAALDWLLGGEPPVSGG